jgi:hypothetical protein
VIYFARNAEDGRIFQGKTAVGYATLGGLNGAIGRYYKHFPEEAAGWVLFEVDEEHNVTEVGRR